MNSKIPNEDKKNNEVENNHKKKNQKEEIKNLQKALEKTQENLVNIHQSLPFRLLSKYDRTIGKTIKIKLKKNYKLVTPQTHSELDFTKLKKSLKIQKLNKKDILCFPIINWDYTEQRPHHVLRKFAQNGHRIFYLTVDLKPHENPFYLKILEDNIYELQLSIPKYFDIFKDTFKENHISTLVNVIRQLKEEINLDAFSFVMFPTWVPLVIELKKQLDFKIIFDCVDEISGFPNINKKRKKEEQILIKNSDLVIASSTLLFNKLSEQNKKTLLLPNSGDFHHFNTASENLLLDYKKPVVGYFGAIAEWFDNKLIEFLAKNKSDISFVFIGDTYGSDLSRTRKLKNVFFLGERPYSELPKYLSGFDVCIIPFKLTKLVLASHPIKVYEYFASGKPIITTKIPDLLKMNDICYIAKDQEDFLEKLNLAIKNKDDLKMIQKRIDFASKNTWQERFNTLYDELKNISGLNIKTHTQIDIG